MPRNTFRVVKKRGSYKKRGGAVGKKTKVQRKSGSRRRIKMIRGGYKLLNDKTDLSYVWNSLFYKRVKNMLEYKSLLDRINPADKTDSESKKVLFVIDMQKDFVDRPYVRKNNDIHPVTKGSDHGGNFAVTDAIKMLGGSETDVEATTNFNNEDTANAVISKSKFLTYIQEALKPESKYKYVIFSRDYHPVGHCSFNNKWFYEQTLCQGCNDGGNFPAHCVQGFDGSKFIPEIEYLIDNLDTAGKAKVVFKGIHKDCDSFTAVQKKDVDHNASNVNTDLNRKSCSSVTGAYLLNGKTAKYAVEFNALFNIEDATQVTYKSDSDLDLSDATHIEVCGLAGDYCVRDTAVALADIFGDKKIIVLNDFTRYPTLPFWTIGILPQHNYGANGSILPVLSDYDKSLIPSNESIKGPEKVEKYDSIREHFNINYKYDKFAEYRNSRASMFLDYVLLNTKPLNYTQNKYKDIVYYLLNRADQKSPLKLMNIDNLLAVNELTSQLKSEIVSQPSYEHFITPFQAIIDDYLNRTNIFIKMDEYEKYDQK